MSGFVFEHFGCFFVFEGFSMVLLIVIAFSMVLARFGLELFVFGSSPSKVDVSVVSAEIGAGERN